VQTEVRKADREGSIGRNTALSTVTNLAVVVMGLLISVVLTRGLKTADQRGVYATLIITNSLLAIVLNLSMAAPFSTLLARGRYRLGEANSVAVVLSLVMGLAALVGTTLVFPLLSGSLFSGVPYTYLLVALLLVAPTIYQVYWGSMMQGLNRLLQFNKVTFALNVSNTLLIVLLVGVLGGGISGFLIGWTINTLAGAVISLVLARRIDPFVWPPSREALRDMVSFGLRVHGTSIAHQLFLRFDAYAVKIILGSSALGLYSLSTSLSERLWILPSAIAPSSISKLAQLPKEESALLTAKVTRTSMLMMLSAAIPFGIIAPWLIPFLYGAQYSESVLPLIILLCGTLGFAGTIVLNNYIMTQMGRPGLLSIISWLELVVSIPLYLVLILWQGIAGAALASALTYLLALAVTMVVFIRDSHLSVMKVLVPGLDDFRDYLRVITSILRSMAR
jgi:O-antigen/teichoic acid export membrane protein